MENQPGRAFTYKKRNGVQTNPATSTVPIIAAHFVWCCAPFGCGEHLDLERIAKLFDEIAHIIGNDASRAADCLWGEKYVNDQDAEPIMWCGDGTIQNGGYIARGSLWPILYCHLALCSFADFASTSRITH